MDILKKKEELKTKFNQAISQRDQLSVMIEQLRGQFALLEEMETEKKDKDKTNAKMDNKS